MDSTPTKPLFVYGILKPTYSIPHMLRDFEMKAAQTVAAHDLVMINDAFPGMVTGTKSVLGYLIFGIDPFTMSQLDRIEGVDSGLYSQQTCIMSDGTEATYYHFEKNIIKWITPHPILYNQHPQLQRTNTTVNYLFRAINPYYQS